MTATHLIELIGLHPCLKGAAIFEPSYLLWPEEYQSSYNEGRIDWLNGGDHSKSSVAATAWQREEADNDSAARAITLGWQRTAVIRRRQQP